MMLKHFNRSLFIQMIAALTALFLVYHYTENYEEYYLKNDEARNLLADEEERHKQGKRYLTGKIAALEESKAEFQTILDSGAVKIAKFYQRKQSDWYGEIHDNKHVSIIFGEADAEIRIDGNPIPIEIDGKKTLLKEEGILLENLLDKAGDWQNLTPHKPFKAVDDYSGTFEFMKEN